jgi:hypothetical protein
MNREPGPLISGNGHPLDDTPFRRYADIFGNHRHSHLMLVREDFAKPANASCERKHSTKDAYRDVCHEACK